MDTKQIHEIVDRVTKDPKFNEGKELLVQTIYANIKDEMIAINGPDGDDSRLLLARIKELLYSNLDYEIALLLAHWVRQQHENKLKNEVKA